MTIRLDRFFCALALSALFSAPSGAAPTSEDELVYTVSTVERGEIPGGMGTMQAPPETAPIIDAYKKHLADSCKESGGKIEFNADFVTAVDVNGDGRADIFMTSQRGFCEGAASYYSGSAGYGSRWAISKPDGSYSVEDGLFHRAQIQETLKNGYQIILHLHGTSCGKGGAAQCRHVVKFDSKGERVSIAWPDGQDRSGEQPKAANAAAPAQGDAVNLDHLWSGSAYDHNKSMVWISPGDGVIVYREPKASIRDVVRPGTVLFRGLKFEEGGRISGTAFAFKKGCPPAPYSVAGGYSRDRSSVTLRGAGPIRKGCEVVGYSERSPHSVLKFVSLISAGEDDYGDI